MSATPTAKKGAGPDAVLLTEDEQNKYLEEAKNQLKIHAFYMNRNLDTNKLMDALKNAADMINELRTSQLSPKRYYLLYMLAFDELKRLEMYLSDERDKHGKKMAELYEIVQYAGNVLPRLYLLVTIGSAYIKCKEAPTKDVLRDLVEMCRGVQHPTRGLFLRNYLSEITKDKLPDLGGDPADGEVRDSVNFILCNFTEMNKLWVRLHQGPTREREKRDGERMELRLLVGKNLARLSQLEGVDSDLYTQLILPRLMDQVIQCRDVMAQQYLTEIIIQVFPDEFHLVTLEPLLRGIGKLTPKVDIKSIISSLIDRLAKFALSSAEGAGIPSTINVFRLFSVHIRNIVAEREMPCVDYLVLQVSLANLCLKVYPQQGEYIDEVLKNAADFMAGLKDPKECQQMSCVQQITQLLSLPIESYGDVLRVLALQNFNAVCSYLLFDKRKSIQVSLLRAMVKSPTVISTAQEVAALLSFIPTLLRDEPEVDKESIDKEDFSEEQNLVAATIHMFRNDNPEILLAMYLGARKIFGQGGSERVVHTLPPLIFSVFKMLTTLKQTNEEWFQQHHRRLFNFEHETIKGLATSGFSELALRLYLQASQVAAVCKQEPHAYEFFCQAFTIYEDEIADSVKQINAMAIIVGTLHSIQFEPDNNDALTTKTAKHSMKLMKKPDQCRAVCMSAHLFWHDQREREGKRVLECLQKSLKIADTCVELNANIHLFVEILNRYLYFFEKRNEFVQVKYLNGLIGLINASIAALEASVAASAEMAPTITFYQNTLAFMRWKKQRSTSGAPYNEIDIP
ncbi:vacuolar protein sorting-associated protein 35 [Pelomyxa schiedti]|nr:vacuolar protein sorting-associated protein 35 [Pelomyxa schiedti]